MAQPFASYASFLALPLIAAGALSLTQPASAKDAGDFLIRLRGIAVVPDVSSTIELEGGTRLNGDAEIDNAYFPEVDFTYFFNEFIAAELVLTTTPHDVTWVNSGIAGDIDLGSFWLLPPTLTVQFHPFPKAQFSPYIGGGISLVHLWNIDSGDNPIVTNVKYTDAVGAAVQVGLDWQFADRWSANIDLKKIFVSVDAKVDTTVGRVIADVDVDPFILGVGIGYRF